MKRILLAVLLAAAPALAHGHSDDDRWGDRDDRYGYDDAGYDQGEEGDAWTDRAQPPPDFRNDSELSWNGRWIETPEYGAVWQPMHVSSDWQPYREGRWAWTDAGWTWVSDEPFGWAVYHYGRWGFSPAMGWYWVPGRVWGPAWVEWRYGDRYAGWCALGPRGVAVVQPTRWVWVETTYMLEPVRHHVVPLPTRYASVMPAAPAGPRAGPPVHVVERAVGRTVVPIAARTVLGPRAAPLPAAAPFRGAPRPRIDGTPARGPQPWNASGPRAQPSRTVAPAQPRSWGGPPAHAPQVAPARPAPSAGPSPRPPAPHAAAPQPRAAPAPTRASTSAPRPEMLSRNAPPHARRSW